jgi:hypothetical protein
MTNTHEIPNLSSSQHTQVTAAFATDATETDTRFEHSYQQLSSCTGHPDNERCDEKQYSCCNMKDDSMTMPKGYQDDDKSSRQPGDIRNYLSPPSASNKSTPRRRRVITSDSEEEDDIGGGEPAITNQTAIMSTGRVENATTRSPAVAPTNHPVHHVSSDDDRMYIGGTRNPRLNATQQQSVREKRETSPLTTRAMTKKVSSKDAPSNVTGRARAKRSRSYRYVGEASETSTDDGQTSDYSNDCIETDTNGVDLYCQAVSSLRNANNARNQLRAATTNCRVCAKFAAFLQHFL